MIEFDPSSKPGLLIRRLHQISVQTFANGTTELELNSVQYGALQAIGANPDIDQTSLSVMVDMDRTTAVKVLDRLVDRGLINRDVCPKDRRVRRMTITPEGKAFIKKHDGLAEATQQTLLAPLSADEQKQFMTMLRRLVEAHTHTGNQ